MAGMLRALPALKGQVGAFRRVILGDAQQVPAEISVGGGPQALPVAERRISRII